jgi:hypothetical protein
VKREGSIDLGLALLSVAFLGQPLTLEDIAAWCDCEPSTIHRIERGAMLKLRRALREFSAQKTMPPVRRCRPRKSKDETQFVARRDHHEP